jgi:signal transduction histidine kinase
MEHYSDALAVLSAINVAEGNYKNAYENFMRYKEIEDSIKSIETKEMIVDVSTKYQTEKKEKENLTLKKKNAEQQLAVQKITNLNQRYSFIAITLGLGIFGLFYYSRNRRRKLRDEHIINLAQAKQKEHEKIGADLHSTKAKDLERIASALEEKGEAAIASKVRDVKDSIRLLSHELFQIPFSQQEFDDQIINLLFEYNNESLKISHQGIHTIPWTEVDNTIKRNLYLIISEAISNVKNHSKASTANVKFQKKNKNIDVTITDNGIGFTEEDLKNGHGIGNMRMRVNEIKGSIRFDAVKDIGSEIGIFITAF